MTYWLITKDNWFGVSTVDSNFKSSEGYTVFKFNEDIPDMKFNTWDFVNQNWIQTTQQKLSRVDFILRFTAAEWSTANASTDIKKTPLQEHIDKVKDSFEVREINGFNVLCKDDLYYGFVSETSIVEAEQGYDSLSELVDSLSRQA